MLNAPKTLNFDIAISLACLRNHPGDYTDTMMAVNDLVVLGLRCPKSERCAAFGGGQMSSWGSFAKSPGNN
jgi:hypothetical protein